MTLLSFGTKMAMYSLA